MGVRVAMISERWVGGTWDGTTRAVGKMGVGGWLPGVRSKFGGVVGVRVGKAVRVGIRVKVGTAKTVAATDVAIRSIFWVGVGWGKTTATGAQAVRRKMKKSALRMRRYGFIISSLQSVPVSG